MNIYYAPPTQIRSGQAELRGQEAVHASKVMRIRSGEGLALVDGRGGRYQGKVRDVAKKRVLIDIEDHKQIPEPRPQLILGMGIIKKRDRLEFAVEKAVELGARHILLIRSERCIKKNVRLDRLESIALSAMKQSLRSWLPEVSMVHSLKETINQFPKARILMAHEEVSGGASNYATAHNEEDQVLLLVGPEGGFTPKEVEYVADAGAELISLGHHRLRAETAVTAVMSPFLK